MIISASYKTDIPAYFGTWFLNRLAAGGCRVRNPYGGPPTEVSLKAADVTGFVFWTRNAAPFTDGFDRVAALGHPFYVQFTATGYPRALEAGTPSFAVAAEQMAGLANRYGPAAVVWRYDPILLSSLTPAAWHRETFAKQAVALRGVTDQVVVSFAQIYRKTARNLNRAADQAGFSWLDPTDQDKRALLADLAVIAADQGLKLSLCAQRHLLIDGATDAACIDPGRLSAVAGRDLAAAAKPHRKACGCAQSRDIGDYDSCAQGCHYCYAVSARDRAKARIAAHDPAGDFLLG